MKYAVVTFGCRVNQADSLAIEAALRARGGTEAHPSAADLLVVNTCSVTAGADQGARQVIRRVVRDNPGVEVVVTGCYATRRPDEVAALPNVVSVVANTDKDALFRDLGDGPCDSHLAPGIGGRTALSLRVQTGCEEKCSYCVIPTTRGASRSKSPAEVMAAVGSAIEAGYREIWITGVHLGSYGRDLATASSLRELVSRLAAIPDQVLFRISSLEPMDCTPAIVDLIAASPRIAPHFHLPLQHGHDEMLNAMARPYTARFYRDLVSHIHDRLPHASIGSDVIVGFPGERASHFDEMAAMLRDLPLSYLHVFPYSDRPGTAASKRADKIDGATIRQRGSAIRAIGAQLSDRFRSTQLGTTRRALVVDDGLSAVTDNYLKVKLGTARPRNTWADVVVA